MKNKHTIAILFFVIILSADTAFAQSKKYKIDKKKYVRVEIVDPGELYSGYELDESEIALLRSQGLNESRIEIILANHTEDVWPPNLGNFDSRVAEPDKMRQYVVYKVAKIGDKYLLVVPAEYNNSWGEGWSLAKDTYFVIGEIGVKE